MKFGSLVTPASGHRGGQPKEHCSSLGCGLHSTQLGLRAHEGTLLEREPHFLSVRLPASSRPEEEISIQAKLEPGRQGAICGWTLSPPVFPNTPLIVFPTDNNRPPLTVSFPRPPPQAASFPLPQCLPGWRAPVSLSLFQFPHLALIAVLPQWNIQMFKFQFSA